MFKQIQKWKASFRFINSDGTGKIDAIRLYFYDDYYYNILNQVGKVHFKDEPDSILIEKVNAFNS